MATSEGCPGSGMDAMRPLTRVHFIRWLIDFLEARHPMVQLRKMRDLERRIRRLTAGRNRLIREAVALGHSERQIAEAAGVSHGRVNQIVHMEES